MSRCPSVCLAALRADSISVSVFHVIYFARCCTWFRYLFAHLVSLAFSDVQHPAYACEDSNTALLHSLRAVQIDDSIERISSSSAVSRDTKHYPSSEDFNHGNIRDTYSSPSKSASIGNFTLPSANSSPNAERHQQIMESPSWRRGGDSFVRHVQAHVDDPFVSSGTGDASSPGRSFFPPLNRQYQLDVIDHRYSLSSPRG